MKEKKKTCAGCTSPISCSEGGVDCDPASKIKEHSKDLPTIEQDSDKRKDMPMARGLLDYAPAALAEISRVSKLAGDKHHPGEELHHERGKSTDHADCVIRHLVERGEEFTVVVEGQEHKIRHSACVAWRAIMLLQQELENAGLVRKPRGAR